jgi:putative addiction module killer protein
MIEVRKTTKFNKWLSSLRDRQAAAKIRIRIDRLALGHFGDVKPVGEGLSELRINCGPGYRVYFVQRGLVLIILLCGGDKASQANDIGKAKLLAKDLDNGT